MLLSIPLPWLAEFVWAITHPGSMTVIPRADLVFWAPICLTGAASVAAVIFLPEERLGAAAIGGVNLALSFVFSVLSYAVITGATL